MVPELEPATPRSRVKHSTTELPWAKFNMGRVVHNSSKYGYNFSHLARVMATKNLSQGEPWVVCHRMITKNVKPSCLSSRGNILFLFVQFKSSFEN